MSESTALRQLMGRWLTLRPFRLPRIRIGGAGGALTGLILLALCLAVLGFWWHNATHLIESARPVVSLERLDLALARGETVTIVYATPGISLSMRGLANDSGRMGAVVNVVNVASKKVLQATVVGPGRVSVGPTGGPQLQASAATSALR